jgi:hypothetical protein
MSTRLRSAFAVMIIGLALAAAAVAPAHSRPGAATDFVGTWITWQKAPDGRPGECRRLYVTAEDATFRDGTWDAPGWNGLVSGTVTEQRGRHVWTGEWRDGRLAGRFAFTLVDGDALQGTFAGPGMPDARAWAGARVSDAGAPDVPCRAAG